VAQAEEKMKRLQAYFCMILRTVRGQVTLLR
jgi:hypothetical protein